MKYYRLFSSTGEPILAVEADDGVLSDLTSVAEDLTDVDDLALAASLTGTSLDDVAGNILDSGEPETYDLPEVIDRSRSGTAGPGLDRPFEPPEVWAAGVTYETSEMERRRESATPDVYSMVYGADRPELFLKATSQRCMGPFESVGIRGDSEWNVPEPELAFVLFRGEIIGYTVGNDVSSRDIEGRNPLYVPQAKVYDRCCAIGPCLVTPDSLPDPHDLGVRLEIFRDDAELFSGEASTSSMARTCDYLADWLQRHNLVPGMTTVLTGTGIVPPPEVSLQEGDVVVIDIEGIGFLENDVIVV